MQLPMTIIDILGDHSPFLNTIFEKLSRLRVDVSGLELDHICYRVETLEMYNSINSRLSKIAERISENEVAGRPISIWKLYDPINFKGRNINFLEIPAPKNRHYDEGYQHIEFVIAEPFDDFMAKYASVKFITDSITNDENPEIAVNFRELAVKFHHRSIAEVVGFKNDK
jgi:predicted metalloenzyme YecM